MSAGLRVCVTGAARGIGQGIAAAYLDRGARVAVNYRSQSETVQDYLTELQERYPGQVLPVRADVSDPAQVKAMFKQIGAEWDGLDLLINNAGHNRDGLALMMSDTAWQSVIDTDLSGAFYCARQAGWLMARRKSGTIVSIASVSAFSSPIGQANYAAAKAGVVAFTRTLAKELAAQNIRVNAVAPGLVATDMMDTLSPSALKQYLDYIPQQQVGTIEHVIDAVDFLASERAAYITGQCLVVDGGLTL